MWKLAFRPPAPGGLKKASGTGLMTTPELFRCIKIVKGHHYQRPYHEFCSRCSVSSLTQREIPYFHGKLLALDPLGVLLTQLHVSVAQEAVAQYVLQCLASLSKLAFYTKQITSLS